jgi:hypothetical protein
MKEPNVLKSELALEYKRLLDEIIKKGKPKGKAQKAQHTLDELRFGIITESMFLPVARRLLGLPPPKDD